MRIVPQHAAINITCDEKSNMSYLGQDIPKLGFGLMRLPQKDGSTDIEQTKAMVDAFLAAGFTYFDTARAYGDSEAVIKQALVDRYPRESYQLASKNAAWLGAKTAEEARAMFSTSLETTEAGYFDFYLLHNLGDPRTQVFDDFDMWDYLAEQKDKGLIKHLGFSYHDKADKLDKILTAHPDMEFVQLQINYADWENEAIQSRANYEVARNHGKPVIIMEPVKGGLLAQPPQTVRDIFDETDPDASPASWALRFAASLDGVITVLSGMSNVEQMEDNLTTMRAFKPLDDTERATIVRAQTALSAFDTIPCTACEYCIKECPSNVAIPDIFNAVNSYRLFGNMASAKNSYTWASSQAAPASACIQCGQCEDVCTQHISIIEELEAAAELFE